LTASPLAHAAQKADLSVSLFAPVLEPVNSANIYTYRISNIGVKDATGSKIKITFPLTKTSPQRYLLGRLSQVDGRCSFSVDTLTCNLNLIRKNKFTDVSFAYSIPVSTTLVQMVAITSTNDQEMSLLNNRSEHQPALRYPSLAIASDASATNSHCTGQSLSAYFECELFPSSISSHGAVFHSNGSLSIPEAPDYVGAWQQSANDRLSFQYFDSNSLRILNFEGFGSVPGCFDGITHFDENPAYVSAYRVCF
jgi:hypothetical protein